MAIAASARSAIFAALACAVVASAAAVVTAPSTTLAQEAQPPAVAPAATTGEPGTQQIAILLVRELVDRLPPLSLLDQPPRDDGIAGARLAIDDNNTTGRFLKQSFSLDTLEASDPAQLIADTVARVDKGAGFVIADVAPDTLVKLADALAGKQAVIFNTSAPDGCARRTAGRTSSTRRPHTPCSPTPWRSISPSSAGATG